MEGARCVLYVYTKVAPTPPGFPRPRAGASRDPLGLQIDAADWEPEKHKDEYRKRLQKVVDRKRKGQTVEVPEDTDDEPSPVPDLMAALEESLQRAKA